MDKNRVLLGKVTLSGILRCITGLHIGASKENIEIGAIDSPVVRDPLSREPYIPGSSLKGKMRALLEKANMLLPQRDGGSGTKRHECDMWAMGEDGEFSGALACPVCRLFGSTGKGDGNNFPARLIVRDLRLTEESRQELNDIDTGLQYTEWKFENAIDRVTSSANPRQIERVPRDAEFQFELVYNVEDMDQAREDLQNLRLALRLLEADALGGHGSRGYGQVRFRIDDIAGKSIEWFRGREDEATVKSVKSIDEIDTVLTIFRKDSV